MNAPAAFARGAVEADGGTQPAAVLPPRQVENLDRGVVAVRTGANSAYVGWRQLGSDPSGIAFDLYRETGTGTAVKLNVAPITASTNYADTGASSNVDQTYFVRPRVNGVEGADSARFKLAATVTTRQYLNLPLQKPAGGTVPNFENPTGPALPFGYAANDVSVGDVDGDGRLEFILKWEPDNAKDNSQSGYTGNVLIDCYTLEGTRLWRIDLGRNIRAGAHYTQFQVYDYDGDGRAELAMKTAPGTIDGAGDAVLMSGDAAAADYRNGGGYILSGPEYLTMFDGLTGAARSTVAYDPPRGITTNNPSGSQLNAIWGDSYGNRADRFLAGTAYLDGQRPSLVVSRGYYTRAVIAAYDFRGGQLVKRWKFDTNDAAAPWAAYRGQGAHSLAIADVDADGRDEVVFGAATIDDNGRGLYSTTLGHGDAEHVGDFLPDRPGLEIFMVHEDPGSFNKNGIDAGGELHDARTGELLLTIPGGNSDVGRGNAFDIDPRHAGAEYWTSANGSIWNYAAVGTDVDGDGDVDPRQVQAKGNVFQNFAIQWDADPLYELLDGTTIADWRLFGANYGRHNYVFAPAGVASNNGSKATPALAGDILGDWRDEVIWRASDSSALQIWTTTIPAATRQYTALHDVQYRTAIAWQNTAYNQPAHPSFFQGSGMATPPRPNIFFAGAAPEADLLDAYQAELAALGGGTTAESTGIGFNGAGYANFPASGGSIAWDGLRVGGGGASTVRLRYALGGAASRSASLVINGVARPVTFAPTGGFDAWQTLSVGVDLAPYAMLDVSLLSTGGDVANVDELQVLRVADTTAPAVLGSATFAFDQTPNVVRVRFAEDVSASLSVTDLAIVDLAVPGTAFVPTAVTYDAATNTATFTLPVLPDGNYRATLVPGGVTDATGNALAAGASLDFFVLVGDFDRDRSVGFADLVALAQNYGLAARTYAQGDATGDGLVNFADLVALAQRYGTALPTNAMAGVVAGGAPTASPSDAEDADVVKRRGKRPQGIRI